MTRGAGTTGSGRQRRRGRLATVASAWFVCQSLPLSPEGLGAPPFCDSSQPRASREPVCPRRCVCVCVCVCACVRARVTKRDRVQEIEGESESVCTFDHRRVNAYGALHVCLCVSRVSMLHVCIHVRARARMHAGRNTVRTHMYASAKTRTRTRGRARVPRPRARAQRPKSAPQRR